MRKNLHGPINRQLGRITSQGRFVAGLFGVVFFGVGLTVLIFLWSASGFGAPPLFFRVVGSLIALAFLGMGGSVAVAAFRGVGPVEGVFDAMREIGDETTESRDSVDSPDSPAHYSCDACGAPLSEEAEISPSGDVKCTYCKNWFNVRGSR